MHIAGFNRSIWNSLWILILVFVLVFAGFMKTFKKGWSYFFDPRHSAGDERAGDFKDHLGRYQDIAKLGITFSAGAIAFLINTLANEKSPLPPIISKIEWSAPIIVGFFGFSIASLISFMLCLTIWYEEYCHSPTHSTYTRFKYATCNCLGYTGLISFVLGFGWLARNLFQN